MKTQLTREDLIETAMEQIKLDVHCGDYEAIEELLKFCPIENLIEYLPEEDWKKFKNLREENKEIRTENSLNNLIKQYPNDTELGREIRKRYGRTS